MVFPLGGEGGFTIVDGRAPGVPSLLALAGGDACDGAETEADTAAELAAGDVAVSSGII